MCFPSPLKCCALSTVFCESIEIKSTCYKVWYKIQLSVLVLTYNISAMISTSLPTKTWKWQGISHTLFLRVSCTNDSWQMSLQNCLVTLCWFTRLRSGSVGFCPHQSHRPVPECVTRLMLYTNDADVKSSSESDSSRSSSSSTKISQLSLSWTILVYQRQATELKNVLVLEPPYTV